MENQKKDQEANKKGENELNASVGKDVKEKPVDDAFKTPNRKHKMEWQQPQDEQMYGRMDEAEE